MHTQALSHHPSGVAYWFSSTSSTWCSPLIVLEPTARHFFWPRIQRRWRLPIQVGGFTSLTALQGRHHCASQKAARSADENARD
jgi:hypothetical protein